MAESLSGLPVHDIRRPQRGDDVQFAGGAYCGRVTETQARMFKVKQRAGHQWVTIDVVESRTRDVVTLQCRPDAYAQYVIGNRPPDPSARI
jgi:hypothetical protein